MQIVIQQHASVFNYVVKIRKHAKLKQKYGFLFKFFLLCDTV